MAIPGQEHARRRPPWHMAQVRGHQYLLAVHGPVPSNLSGGYPRRLGQPSPATVKARACALGRLAALAVPEDARRPAAPHCGRPTLGGPYRRKRSPPFAIASGARWPAAWGRGWWGGRPTLGEPCTRGRPAPHSFPCRRRVDQPSLGHGEDRGVQSISLLRKAIATACVRFAAPG
jgi:hypothetical protein